MWALLLIPFVGLLWVPFYNFLEPSLFGFPFFYWYQFAWVPITSFLIWLVYRSRTPDETQEQDREWRHGRDRLGGAFDFRRLFCARYRDGLFRRALEVRPGQRASR
jgi:hypothetical protein